MVDLWLPEFAVLWNCPTRTHPRAGRALVWRQRRFGNQVLWNGSYDDAGNSLRLSADEVPDQPTDTILCDSIPRFNGLDRIDNFTRA